MTMRRSDSPDTRESVIDQYSPLIEKILLDLHSPRATREDLRQVGYLGLLTALELYDPARETPFPAFAAHFIRGEIRHYLRDHGDTIRQPRWLYRLNRRIEEVVGHFLSAERRYPTLGELAARLNIQEAGLLEVLKTREAVRTVSLDVQEDEGQFTLDRRRIRHRVYVSFHLPIEDKIVLYQATDRLSLLQRRVLYYLFFAGLSQIEAARRIGISQRHVSRVLAQSLRSLRQLLGGG